MAGEELLLLHPRILGMLICSTWEEFTQLSISVLELSLQTNLVATFVISRLFYAFHFPSFLSPHSLFCVTLWRVWQNHSFVTLWLVPIKVLPNCRSWSSPALLMNQHCLLIPKAYYESMHGVVPDKNRAGAAATCSTSNMEEAMTIHLQWFLQCIVPPQADAHCACIVMLASPSLWVYNVDGNVTHCYLGAPIHH